MTQLGNEATFTAVIKELFDVAHANALDLITNKDDKLFHQSQRKKGRPGCMGGVDKITERQEAQENKKQKDHDEKFRKRRYRSQIEKNALMEKVELASSSDEEE